MAAEPARASSHGGLLVVAIRRADPEVWAVLRAEWVHERDPQRR